MSLISIVVALVIVGVVLYLLTLLPIDANIRKIINVVVILFAVLWVLQALGLFHTGVRLR